jgi:hypothetical protein
MPLSLASRVLLTLASQAKKGGTPFEGVPPLYLKTVCCDSWTYIPFLKLLGVTPAKRRKDVVK